MGMGLDMSSRLSASTGTKDTGNRALKKDLPPSSKCAIKTVLKPQSKPRIFSSETPGSTPSFSLKYSTTDMALSFKSSWLSLNKS
jgi:hypothetical protein